jgi:transcriptional regulator with XRE-family HTH domain
LLRKKRDQAGKNRYIQPLPGPERSFGEALRALRKERGISQEQLALDSGLDRTYISLIERGVQSPTIRSVVKIAAVLCVRPSDIIIRMEAQQSSTRPTRQRN